MKGIQVKQYLTLLIYYMEFKKDRAIENLEATYPLLLFTCKCAYLAMEEK